jgi:hypothetical protein
MFWVTIPDSRPARSSRERASWPALGRARLRVSKKISLMIRPGLQRTGAERADLEQGGVDRGPQPARAPERRDAALHGHARAGEGHGVAAAQSLGGFEKAMALGQGHASSPGTCVAATWPRA